ncbi:hypothetical protein Dxin01_04075 [Deinococcus xinjiangensis]|uniref:Uncharacterized protein n=1 Tax=Deinococcus xinjiangensis TaxID=457454 RepID=A0ABP9VJ70_9DEIO
MDRTDGERVTLAQLGQDGALFATDLQRMTEGHYWLRLVKQGLVLEAMSDLGLVLGLTSQGRQAVLQDDLLNGDTPPYLASPTSLLDRAYQMLVLRHLVDDRGYKVMGAYYKSAAGLPRGKKKNKGDMGGDTGSKEKKEVTKRQYTDQRLSLVVEPPAYQPPPLDLSEDGRRAYPLVYAPLGQGPASGKTFRRLYYLHRQQTMRWRSPVLLAVPAWTPDLRRQQELLQERKNTQKVIEILVIRPD